MSASRIGLATGYTLIVGAAVQGDFSGPYAPEQWSFITDAGGFVKSHTADELVLIGGDISTGGGAGDTDLTITAIASGAWSFNWQFVGNCGDIGGVASGGFDNAYYLINGTSHFLGTDGYPPGINKVSVSINAGDVIGFRVDSTDGIFGPGTLTITNFSAPVPGPGAIAAVLPLMMAVHRRRRRASLEPRKCHESLFACGRTRLAADAVTSPRVRGPVRARVVDLHDRGRRVH